ncbi:hypothetical protein HON36_01545 [Candidatus Parcubacteria bacterium]|jgi:hypothetical protein|nr:hypothetical protein [Candidatus Parcubacteria bacterium]MBT7228133.1 hypothetical protein [Candidatus Parcubacteria bacterium]
MDKKEFCTDLQQMVIAHNRALADFARFLEPEYLSFEHRRGIPDIKHMSDYLENLFRQIFEKFKIREMEEFYAPMYEYPKIKNKWTNKKEWLAMVMLETNMRFESRKVFKQHLTIGSSIKKLPRNLEITELIIQKDAMIEELPDDVVIHGLSLHKKDLKLESQCKDLKMRGQIEVLEIF